MCGMCRAVLTLVPHTVIEHSTKVATWFDVAHAEQLLQMHYQRPVSLARQLTLNVRCSKRMIQPSQPLMANALALVRFLKAKHECSNCRDMNGRRGRKA